MPGLIHAAAVAFRFALVVALCGAVWGIYRSLPEDAPAGGIGDGDSASQPVATTVRLILRRGAGAGPPSAPTTFQLYPIDVAAEQRSFNAKRRIGVRFDDFLTQRMGKRQPVTGQFDERGEATARVPPGKWWVHAELNGAPQDISWRLPINVAGRERVVELTPENSYARAKSF